jgi:hypothetical protein
LNASAKTHRINSIPRTFQITLSELVGAEFCIEAASRNKEFVAAAISARRRSGNEWSEDVKRLASAEAR